MEERLLFKIKEITIQNQFSEESRKVDLEERFESDIDFLNVLQLIG